MSASRLYTLTAGKQDPTNTKTIRDTYARRLRGRFGALSAAMREAIVKDDVLGLRDSDLSESDVDQLTETFGEQHELKAIDSPPDLSSLPPAERIARFEDWLDEVEESEILDVIQRDENIWVRRAYERGIKDANANLKNVGIPVSGANASDTIRVPVHQRRLESLFARNYAELDGITDAVSQNISRELATGLSEGISPSEMARRITDRVDKIGKTRATTLARTEIINSHTEATLQRYEEQDIETVGIEPEMRIQTAGDNSVCQECRTAAEQGPWPISEFRGSGYQPPLHPNCRCAVLPVVNETAAAAFQEHPVDFTVMLRAGAFVRNEGFYTALAQADADEARELTAQAVAT